MNGEELCEQCGHNFDRWNEICVDNVWRGGYTIYEDRNCNFESATKVFEHEATPWDSYGATLTVSECMKICSLNSGCDTIVRLIDGSKCEGYSYVLYFFLVRYIFSLNKVFIYQIRRYL